MGPTAAGKTALVMELYQQFPLEIINVDSSQVYRGMDIGTAKPSADELARVPHRLIDIRDPLQAYSAAEFREDALAAMQEITQQGRIPLLAGGTIFYFHALQHGLSRMPAADAAIRAQLSQEAETLGWPALHARLAVADPVTAARINPNDSQRLQRALELLQLTGQAPSALMQKSQNQPLPYELIPVALTPSNRLVLHARIAQRFETMLQAGFLQEVKNLIDREDLTPALPSLRTVGYRQAWEYLTQGGKHSEMVAKAVAATRQLAKRQLTWIRGYDGVKQLDCLDAKLVSVCTDYLSGKLDKLRL